MRGISSPSYVLERFIEYFTPESCLEDSPASSWSSALFDRASPQLSRNIGSLLKIRVYTSKDRMTGCEWASVGVTLLLIAQTNTSRRSKDPSMHSIVYSSVVEASCFSSAIPAETPYKSNAIKLQVLSHPIPRPADQSNDSHPPAFLDPLLSHYTRSIRSYSLSCLVKTEHTKTSR